MGTMPWYQRGMGGCPDGNEQQNMGGSATVYCPGMGARFPGGFKSVASRKEVIRGFPGGFKSPVRAWLLDPMGGRSHNNDNKNGGCRFYLE